MGERNVLERILLGLENPRDLSLALLEEITDNFSNERIIGKGGFGVVYMGVLQKRNVAVKRIIMSEHTVDDKLFYREVINLMNIISHQNVVRFLGFCYNTTGATKEVITGSAELVFVQIRERLLCFEYINNGSLDKHITDELRGLEWNTRYAIIKGICDGLHYLHKNNIIHMDLKPGNIMLDNDMVPKITDFGLSRLDKYTHTSGTPFITHGYCAPEYADDCKTSQRADIYSLGVIITELLTGEKGYPSDENVLRRWGYRWKKSAKHTLLSQYRQVTKCMKIAAQCRKKEPADRPLLLNIIGILSETESANWHIEEISLYSVDDMLGIEPLELKFPFEVQKQISCAVMLTNETEDYFAFNIEMPGRQYLVKPNEGIVPPRSNYSVNIAMPAHEIAPQDMPYSDDIIIVQSTKVDWDDHIAKDITAHMFNKQLDEVNLTVVVYDPNKSQGNVISVEAVSKGNEWGECAKQLDGRHFHPPVNFSDSQPTNMSFILRASDRAMDVTSGSMGSLLHKLGELLKDEFNLMMNVREDIKSSSRELMEMHVALRKVSQVQRENLDDLIKRWANDAREMSYKIEDVIDGFLVLGEPAANTGGFSMLTHEMFSLLAKGTPHHQISNVVKDIKVQVNEVADQCDRYKVGSVVANPTTSTPIDPRLLDQYRNQREMVGIDGTRDEITKRLFDGDDDASKKQLKIISIFGFGGLGKTTLAKAVYDRLLAQFDYGAFVSVGRNPDFKKFFKDTLFELDKERYKDIHSKKWEERHLIDELRIILSQNTYFIVIDDLWSIEAWEIIMCVLVDSNCGSKVLTTTRILEVATETGIVYKLEPLSDGNSKELFYKKLFRGKRKRPYNDSAELPEKILYRCGGVPLAIITMASLLAGKQRENWYQVYKSIGFGDGENKEVENTRKILLFSYYDLPCYLRTCLLHLGIFPEDHPINKETLIWKWIAEGFIHEEAGVGLFELGERYFSELINRSLIQPMGAQYGFTASACRLHDMVLDMICSLSKEHNFLTVLDTSEQHTSSQNNARRLAIQNRVLEQKNPLGTIPAPQVRSFYAISCDIIITPSLISFKALRVLAMEGCSGPCNLEHIGKLHQLRYLGFERMLIRELPEEIQDLRFLQTLWLDGTKITELRHSVGLLRQLKCLRAGKCWGLRVPDWIGKLSSLEELSLCNVNNSPNFAEELTKLTELRDLRITFGSGVASPTDQGGPTFSPTGWSMDHPGHPLVTQRSDDESWHRALVESIGNLRKMERLEITCDRIGSFTDVWEGFVPSRTLRTLHIGGIRRPRLLPWINSDTLPRLTHLTMRVESLEVQDVETLGRFPELLALELKPNGVGCLMALTSGDLFPSLRYLNTFAALRIELGAAENLEYLEFKVDVWDLQRACFDFDFSSLGNLRMLEEIQVEMDCSHARRRDVEKAEKSLKRAVDIHPNRPIFDLTKLNEEYIIHAEDESESDEEGDSFLGKIVRSTHSFCCRRHT